MRITVTRSVPLQYGGFQFGLHKRHILQFYDGATGSGGGKISEDPLPLWWNRRSLPWLSKASVTSEKASKKVVLNAYIPRLTSRRTLWPALLSHLLHQSLLLFCLLSATSCLLSAAIWRTSSQTKGKGKWKPELRRRQCLRRWFQKSRSSFEKCASH